MHRGRGIESSSTMTHSLDSNLWFVPIVLGGPLPVQQPPDVLCTLNPGPNPCVASG